MRILHFYKTSLPTSFGGVEQLIDQIARGSGAHGVKVDVLALTPDRRETHTTQLNGYTLHRAKSDFKFASTDFSAEAITRFADLARQADVIHYHFPWPFMDFVHFATKVKNPVVVTYHSDIIRQKFLKGLYQPLMNRFLNQADRIIATSPNYLATSAVLRRYASKTKIIPIGLDIASYPEPTLDQTAYWRARFGSGFFLFVGSLRYYKGLHILLEAARQTQLPVVIVGAGAIGREIEAKAKKLNLTNVHLLGIQSEANKVALLQLCRAVVFPSNLRAEAFGISLLEGAMFGKPMISSEIGTGTSFVNIKDETGLVIPANDPDALSRAMRLLWANEDMAVAMGQRAAQRQQQHFRADQMVSAYVDLYRELVG